MPLFRRVFLALIAATALVYCASFAPPSVFDNQLATLELLH